MDYYLDYLQTFWVYFPYLFYTFVFVTFLPKSFGKIKNFADKDYEANRYKYHRCYGPNLCCHSGAAEAASPKPKARKAVTRVYPKRSANVESTESRAEESRSVLKRQVQPSAIHTQTNVNQIAKMFESGGATTTVNKKVLRVTPTILPQDIHTYRVGEPHEQEAEKHDARKLSQVLQEDIENSFNSLNVHQIGDGQSKNASWHELNAPIRKRPVPQTLSLSHGGSGGGGGTSATPSTASPAASSSLSSSPHSVSPEPSPLLRSAPLLNMQSSLEDIFAAIARNAEKTENYLYAGCNTLSPVTSIEDILSQRRLSRPLSAYSISDLLNEENSTPMTTTNASHKDEVYVENFLRTLNKT